MNEPVDFLEVPLAGGGTYKRLDRLTDGRVMCCICFGYFTREELKQEEDGMVWDMCRDCAEDEKHYEEEACNE